MPIGNLPFPKDRDTFLDKASREAAVRTVEERVGSATP
jgi:hypothetical protein